MKKILVVDDTKNIRLLLSKSLTLEGYEVETAADGRQALDMFNANRYDLAFLDIKLPEVRGTEVLRRIREMGIMTPVVIITAYATVKNAVDCTKMGAVAYLQKPFTGDKIKAVMEELGAFASGSRCGEVKNGIDAAESLIAQGKFAPALEILKAELSKDMENPRLYLLIGKAYEGDGQSTKAEKFFNACKLFSS